MLRVLKQKVSIVVANSTNRISSDPDIIMMLQGICDAKGTTLLIASECGKSIWEVAEVEKNRVVKRANVERLYHENIANLAKELDGSTKRTHNELKLLGKEVKGRVISARKSAAKRKASIILEKHNR